jgi:hypothetical protein
MQTDPYELAQLDREATRRIEREAFISAHAEYTTPVVLTAAECEAMDDVMEWAP